MYEEEWGHMRGREVSGTGIWSLCGMGWVGIPFLTHISQWPKSKCVMENILCLVIDRDC